MLIIVRPKLVSKISCSKIIIFRFAIKKKNRTTIIVKTVFKVNSWSSRTSDSFTADT